jgi:HPt (histidine-containing phosphotransfer) domain-containing protein
MSEKVDLTYLKEIAMGSKEFMLDMIDSFKSKTPEELEKMESAYLNKEYETMGKVAHKLKSSFSFMGMSETASTCKELQNMGLQLERIEEMPDKINSIQQAFKSSLVDLDEEIKNL